MIETVLDFLKSPPPIPNCRKCMPYSWMYLVWIPISIIGAVTARELRNRFSKNRSDVSLAIKSDKILKASIYFSTDLKGKRVEAEITKELSVFKLTVTKFENELKTKTTHKFSNIEQLEKYLESHTILRLGDFKTT